MIYNKEKHDEIIKKSHKRSEQYGIEKERIISRRILKGDAILNTIHSNEELVKIAAPFIKNLYNFLIDSGFFIILTDKEGCILKMVGDGEILSAAYEMDMIIGAYMNEESIGTNAMGTAINEDMAIQVSAKEHFITAYHKWTCSAAPIHNEKGQIIGTLNLTGSRNLVHPHTLGLVVSAVNSIESQIKKVVNLVNKYPSTGARYTFEDTIGKSEQIKKAIQNAKQISDSPSTVLIEGESGTGKELLAQAIHNESERRECAFVAINCGAISQNLIESELFGYEDGAFTGAKRGGHLGKFEMANGGTLFLDEIGEMPLEMQVRLLRVLQEGMVTRVGGNKVIPVDVRIISATNKELRKEVAKGLFRQDLYYRLSVIPIILPPLRERREDIPYLIEHFLRGKAQKLQKQIPSINKDLADKLMRYSWPGNIRELENVIENIVNFNGDTTFTLENFSDIEIKTENIEKEFCEEQVSDKICSLEEVEKKAILFTMKALKGNMTQVARSLGISRNTLYCKLKKYEIVSE